MLIEEVQRSCSNVNFDNVIAGTVDTWVLWNLTGGQVHAIDHTNASRTMLMNLADRDWDTTLLDLFGISARMMPQMSAKLRNIWSDRPPVIRCSHSNCGGFWRSAGSAICSRLQSPWYGEMYLWHWLLLNFPYRQRAKAMVAERTALRASHHQLLSTVAWSYSAADGTIEASYAIEGAMFTTGACIQWLRDGLKLINGT